MHNLLKIFNRFISLFIITLIIGAFTLVTPPNTFAESMPKGCISRGAELCSDPFPDYCSYTNKCCSSTTLCDNEEGNVNVSADDTSLTPAQVRAELSGDIAADPALTSPGSILSKLLPYLFVFGGLILFVMLIWGGFEMMGGATNPKASENGKNRITAAFKGFIILFVAVWIAQLAETIFGINILGN